MPDRSIAVKDITDRYPDTGTGIAYFYFSFQKEAAQTIKNFFAVLVKQLSGQKTRLPHSLLSLYTRCSRKDQIPRLEELQAEFHNIIQTFNNVFIVVDALDECKKDTLETASYYQCNEVVELLLDHGADVNMQGGLFANALQAACAHRALSFAERSKGKIVRESIVQCLVERGANVTLLGGIYGTALHAAAFAGYKSTVLVLLHLGANPHIQGTWGMNVLEIAFYAGHILRTIDRVTTTDPHADKPGRYTDDLLEVDRPIITNADWDDDDDGTQRFQLYVSAYKSWPMVSI
jgi:hypothetical protein